MTDVWAVQRDTSKVAKHRKLHALNGIRRDAPASDASGGLVVASSGGGYRDVGFSDLIIARKPSGVKAPLPVLASNKRSDKSDLAVARPRGRDPERHYVADSHGGPQRSPSVSPTGRPSEPSSPTLLNKSSLLNDNSPNGSGGRRSSHDNHLVASGKRSTNSNAAAIAAAAALRTPSPISTVGKLPPIDAHRYAVGDDPSKRPSARTPPAKPLHMAPSGASSSSVLPPVATGPLSTRQPSSRMPMHMDDPPLMATPGDDDDGGYLTAPEDASSVNGANGIPVTGRKNRIRVAVRKRPLNAQEGGEDCVNIEAPIVHVEARKLRVDLTEYVESHNYAFDDSFDAHHTNEQVYSQAARGLVDGVFEGGSASCFAYGQTGSGKTHTMMGNDTEPGLYILAATDIFARLSPSHRVFVSLYEIYCNSLFDLLNHRAVVVTREDANKRVNVCGLTWHEVTSVKELLRVMERGAVQRRTGSTSANEFSSRSHAVMTITLRDEAQPKFLGMLNVVDLAGSERAADTAANDKQTRLEGAEINKSLLALKECIRGLDERKKHIPFRGSKLTEVLRDSFVGNSRTVMIATVSPSTTNAEHSLNTLRYAFRVKGLSIDKPQPCAERNAPRPTQRTKSASNLLDRGARDSSAAPVTKDKKKRKKTDRRGDHHRRRRGDIDDETLLAFELEMKEGMERLRSELESLRSEKQKDDAMINDLQHQNEDLIKRLETMRRMYTYHDATEEATGGGGGGGGSDDEAPLRADSRGEPMNASGKEKKKKARRRRSSAIPLLDEEPVKIEELAS